MGSYDELMKKGKDFSKLLARQESKNDKEEAQVCLSESHYLLICKEMCSLFLLAEQSSKKNPFNRNGRHSIEQYQRYRPMKKTQR